MRWIVDGMNLIGSRPDGWWHDRPHAMRALVEELQALDEPVTVVFDGRPLEIDGTVPVEVRFASRRGPNAADDDIVELVANAAEPATLRVVTSDRALARRVEQHGARVVGVAKFREP